MIVDLILDRKDGKKYDPHTFFTNVSEYDGIEIASALDGGEEEDVKKELCAYIQENEYNTDICTYIMSVDWL